ncbi:MAG: hypothetical protein KC486_25215 [Myxococcales bacterium]|nr:hypothetical protein [Myxococcales bacterium]
MTRDTQGRGWTRGGGLPFARGLVALALVLGCSTTATPSASGEGGGPAEGVDEGEEHAPAIAPPDVPLPDVPVTYADELANVDARIAAIRHRAQALTPSWVTLETLTGALLERAQLTGDYDDYAAAEEALEEAFALAGEGTGPWMTRARLHFTLHRLDAADADLDRLSERLLLDDRQQAAIDGLRADIAFQRGGYGAALEDFLRIAEAKPGVTSLARLATYRWKTGDFDGADALYKRALEEYDGQIAQPRAWLRLMRGLLDLDRGRYHEAYAHYRNAEAELSGFWLIEEHIAEIRARLGEPAAAMDLYEDLIVRTRNPEFMDALADLKEEAGDAERAAALRKEAREAYEALLDRYPEAAAGHALGHYLGRGDAPARALELAEANHTLRPNGEAKILFAEALLAAGQAAQAQQVIEDALASPWRSAQLHLVASEIFAARGDAERAASELAEAERINPRIAD